MKILVALCLFAVAVTVYGETCNKVTDCSETLCKEQDGWWLHCKSGNCLCSHDTFTGKPCSDGQTTTCVSAHGNQCQDHGLHWICVDNTCHCTKRH